MLKPRFHVAFYFSELHCMQRLRLMNTHWQWFQYKGSEQYSHSLTFEKRLSAFRKAILERGGRECLRLLLALLGQEDGLDVGQDASLSDGDTAEQLVQLLVVADGQLQVTGDDPRLLVVASGITRKLEDLSSEVLHDCGQVHRSSGTDTLSIVSLAEQTVDTTDGELETSTRRAGLRLPLHLTTLATARHDSRFVRERRRRATTRYA